MEEKKKMWRKRIGVVSKRGSVGGRERRGVGRRGRVGVGGRGIGGGESGRRRKRSGRVGRR